MFDDMLYNVELLCLFVLIFKFRLVKYALIEKPEAELPNLFKVYCSDVITVILRL